MSTNCGAASRNSNASPKHDPEKACPGRDPGWEPVSGLREAMVRCLFFLIASAGEGRSDKIMRKIAKPNKKMR
jgi:hypothetical protein